MKIISGGAVTLCIRSNYSKSIVLTSGFSTLETNILPGLCITILRGSSIYPFSRALIVILCIGTAQMRGAK